MGMMIATATVVVVVAATADTMMAVMEDKAATVKADTVREQFIS